MRPWSQQQQYKLLNITEYSRFYLPRTELQQYIDEDI